MDRNQQVITVGEGKGMRLDWEEALKAKGHWQGHSPQRELLELPQNLLA